MGYTKHSIAIGNYAILSLFVIGVLLIAVWPSAPSNPLSLFTKAFHCKLISSDSSARYDVPIQDELEAALAKASMPNKTVIIAMANKAYVDQDVNANTTMLDIFLNSFWLGDQETRVLVDHLLLVAVDQTAYDRCQFLGLKSCYKLVTEGVDYGGEKLYMSQDFIKMMWARTSFLLEVLKRGYSFIFTDTDVMWLRNPFEKLSKDESEDLQISVDFFNGNPWSARNPINTGFYFIRSNNKTIALFERWYTLKNNSRGMKEQDVLLKLIRGGIIPHLGLKVRFLNTLFFSGFCQNSKDFTQVTTVHANCCRTIVAKINDLHVVLRDWKRFKKSTNLTQVFSWSRHLDCANSWKRH